jgi:hypothetical protein
MRGSLARSSRSDFVIGFCVTMSRCRRWRSAGVNRVFTYRKARHGSPVPSRFVRFRDITILLAT